MWDTFSVLEINPSPLGPIKRPVNKYPKIPGTFIFAHIKRIIVDTAKIIVISLKIISI